MIFIAFDREIKILPRNRKFFLDYPFTSMFIKQPGYRRSIIATQLFTCELLMLTLIGAFMEHFDSPTTGNNASFLDYYGWQLSRGAAAWALTQVFTIPIFILNAYTIHGHRTDYITNSVCFIIILISFGAVIAMTVSYCYGYTEYWIVNFLIFLLLDLFTLQIIYAILTSIFIKMPSEYNNTNIDSARGENENRFSRDIPVKKGSAQSDEIAENNENDDGSYYSIVIMPSQAIQ